jgi:hypothetical protein
MKDQARLSRLVVRAAAICLASVSTAVPAGDSQSSAPAPTQRTQAVQHCTNGPVQSYEHQAKQEQLLCGYFHLSGDCNWRPPASQARCTTGHSAHTPKQVTTTNASADCQCLHSDSIGGVNRCTEWKQLGDRDCVTGITKKQQTEKLIREWLERCRRSPGEICHPAAIGDRG